MRLGTYVACAVKELEGRNLYPGKTNIQKLIYFALPEEQRKRRYSPTITVRIAGMCSMPRAH